MMLSLWGFQFLCSREHRVLEVDFRSLARDQVSTIERELRSNLAVLESLRAFYSAVPQVGHEQFEAFAAPLRGQHQGIQALEWIRAFATRIGGGAGPGAAVTLTPSPPQIDLNVGVGGGAVGGAVTLGGCFLVKGFGDTECNDDSCPR